jgi:hypothetical protein
VAVDAATDEFRVLEALGAEPVAPAQGSMTMSFNVDTETARCVAMALLSADMYRARDTMFDELRVETHKVLVTHLKRCACPCPHGLLLPPHPRTCTLLADAGDMGPASVLY